MPDEVKRKPPNAGKGRVKGNPNKLTVDIKKMIIGALNRAGGEDYLLEQSGENPVAFMGLVAKILPRDVNLKVNELDDLSDDQLSRQLASIAAQLARAGIGIGEGATEEIPPQSIN